jgi:predicted nuclease of predicted toxin-antitoxin system
MAYAKSHGFVVLTHDLDFGAILAATHAEGPSVVQIRTEDVMSDQFVSLVLTTLTRFENELSAGALVIVDETRSRVRVLPMV